MTARLLYFVFGQTFQSDLRADSQEFVRQLSERPRQLVLERRYGYEGSC